jgi:TPP-dependent indolepyruvate ferredoxin oxidoreductase alpha subunit
MSYSDLDYSKPVDIENFDKVVSVLSNHTKTHVIKMTVDCSSTNMNSEYDDMMQRRPHYIHTYTCHIMCDKCGWHMYSNSSDPQDHDRFTFDLMNLASAFTSKIPADCYEAKALKAAAEIHEC